MDVAPVGGGAHHFHRVGAGIDIDMSADTERLNINAFSGNDSLVSAPGTTVATTVDAGPGNDTITTGDGADLIQGGTGADTLSGGAGADRIVGNQGNDTDQRRRAATTRSCGTTATPPTTSTARTASTASRPT